MKYNDFDWNDIIFEAPEDEFADDELSATDYADADGMDIEAEDPPSEDTGEEEMEDDTDPADEDPMAEDEEGDPTDEDPMAEEGEEGDPADEDPLSDENADENSEEEQTDNTENVVSNKQNANLIKDFIELHKRIDEIMLQMRADCNTNIKYNPNILVVRKNLEKLKDTTYEYIVNKFAKESYIVNLYQFNLIIQAVNTNIDLFSSVLASNKKHMEKLKTKKKR